MVEIARIQSIEESNAFEGIRTTDTRLKQLIKEKITPKNRSEKEIAGYRDALAIIHENYDYISGMFIWTGIDYIGETSFPFPTKYSDFGVLDVCGFPKDAYYFYRSVWNEKDITLHILPHWNWPDRKGEKTPVWCYTNCDEVELFLNGKSQGIRKSGDNGMLHLEWNDVLYETGELKAVGYVNGKKVQSRWFDHEGKVIRNRDYDHQDAHHTHIFPHDHDWVWKDNRPIRDTQWVDPDFIRYPEDKS